MFEVETAWPGVSSGARPGRAVLRREFVYASPEFGLRGVDVDGVGRAGVRGPAEDFFGIMSYSNGIEASVERLIIDPSPIADRLAAPPADPPSPAARGSSEGTTQRPPASTSPISKGPQPSSSSGGQDRGGPQDQVYVIGPDGFGYRYSG